MTVSTIAAATIPAPTAANLFGTVETLSTTNRLLGMSRNRTTLYARSGGSAPNDRTLRISTDDGTTWSDVASFSYTIEGITELDDGEALVVCQGGTATPGYVYRSTGWATNRATATWALVLTTQAGYIRSVWGMHQWSSTGTVVVANEYGSQTTSSGDQSDKATRVYLSEDSGRTWRVILDLLTMFPGAFPLHVHATAYDPVWDRIWLTYGDSVSHLPATSALTMYSDDRGSSWTHITKPAAWATAAAGGLQSTTLAVTDRAVVALPDGVPYGITTHLRRAYQVADPLQIGATWAGNTGSQGIGYGAHRAYGAGERPLLATTQGASVFAPALLLADPSGTGGSFVEVFRDTTSGTSTIHTAVGPTASGRIVFALANTMRRAVWKPDTTPPVTTLTTPAAGSTTNRSVTAGGGFTDA